MHWTISFTEANRYNRCFVYVLYATTVQINILSLMIEFTHSWETKNAYLQFLRINIFMFLPYWCAQYTKKVITRQKELKKMLKNFFFWYCVDNIKFFVICELWVYLDLVHALFLLPHLDFVVYNLLIINQGFVYLYSLNLHNTSALTDLFKWP